MKVRFFYAPPIFNTWSRLLVLSDDGMLYTSFLINLKLTDFNESVNFTKFNPSEYLFQGYQPITEITRQQALSAELTLQTNWVQEYLEKIGA
jgi:hypothetical protein